jgi:hypothetical protein
LLTFWLSCSPKRTTDLFPDGIEAIQTEPVYYTHLLTPCRSFAERALDTANFFR